MAIRLTVDDNTSAVLTLGANDETTLSADAATVVAIDNYNDLRSKPQIEGVELVGDKSLNDLGAYTDDQVDTLLSAKADRSDIPSLDGYATEQWVENKHYLTTETDPVFKASAAYGITASDVSNWNNKSDFSGNYNDLTNKPTIPSKTSQLTNDSGFITDAGVTSWNNQTGAVTFSETDPTVPAWAKAPNKPTYTASEVGAVPITRKVNDKALSADITLTASDVDALPSNTPIPTKTSDLTNDSGFLTSAVTTFNGQSGAVTYSAPVSSVNGQTGVVSLSIPTKTSDLTNDSGFVDVSGASAAAPVQSVNGGTGTVVLDADDVGALPTTEKSVLFYGQVDSTSTATVFTAQIDGITEYFDGLTVMLKNGVVTSASGFTININNLGAKHAYSNMAAATEETTLFNINYTMMFTYDSTRVEGGGWILYRGYNSNDNTIGYQLRTNSMSLPMKSITYRYRLLFESADGEHFVPANSSTSTNATASRTVCQDAINPFGTIRYYGTTASVAAGSRPSATNLWQQYGITLGYSFNRTGAALTLTSWKPVYVKCAPQSDGSAIIDSTTPYVQDLPTTEDGKIYIYLGVAYSATNIELTAYHPVYWYKDGQIRPYTNALASSGGVTSWNGQTGDVTYTAPVTSVNGNTGAVTVTEGLAPLIGTTSTVTVAQVMTALGEGRDVCLSADSTFNQVNITLKFTGFNRVTDSDYGGMALDMAIAQTVASVDGVNFGVWTLVGGTYNNTSIPWTVLNADIATKAYAVPMTRTINNHALSSDFALGADDVGAITMPNGANRGDFLVYNGSAWQPQSLSTWQGGNY